jgi:glycosyltransferase involved in cell wall biosynthesis
MTLIEAGGQDDPWDHHLLFFGIEPVAPAYIDFCSRLGIPYTYVASQEGVPWSAWPELVRAIKSVQADALILHSIKAIAAARFAFPGGPLIAVEHQANSLKTRAEWFASAMSQRLADRVVMLSPDYDHTIRGRLGPIYSPARTVIVPTGINLSPFIQKRTPREPEGSIRIGMAARFSPTKAQATLVEALGHLLHSYPGTNWQLSLPGDGVCRQLVVETVRSNGLEDRIDLPGHVAPVHLLDWIATLDFYAHASDGETLSTALLQAMAAGVPVVASDVPGISDLLGPPAPGEEPLGLLVPARNAHAFASAIAASISDPARTINRANRARRHVVSHHSPEVMRNGYAALIESLS